MHFLGIVFLLLALGGCSDKETIQQLEADKIQLQTQVHRLQRISKEAQEKIDVNYAKQMATFDEAEHLAGIAAGCRVFVNVCPKSTTAPGDAAIAAGASGVGTWAWWSIYLIKVAVFLVTLGAAAVLWTTRLRPDLNAQRLADQELEQARADLKETYKLHDLAKRRAEEVELALASSQIRLDSYKDQIEKTKGTLDALEQAEIQKKAALDALSSFKL